MFLKGKLSGGASSGSAGKLQKKLDDILKKSLVVWKSGLVTSFKKLTSDFLLPQTFFIISHNQLGALYEDAFNDPDLSRFMRLGKPAFVSSLSGKYLSNFCVNKSTVPTDAPLSLEAIFVDKLR